MSTDRKARLLDWGFRLFLFALLALWVIAPPQSTTPSNRHIAQEVNK